jgi:hypothetical protein
MGIRHSFALAAALALGSLLASQASQAFVTVGVSITIAPPALPVYEQPPIPDAGYMWTPGYWAYDQDGGYYWVPGTWVPAPQPGYLWTPGYWGWNDGVYAWNEGYWGPHVGFYGGVNYGFGYVGSGYAGGEWRGGAFFYNSSVNNVGSVHITNVYNQTVVNNATVNRVSYNGGNGGIQARPTPAEQAVAHEPHLMPIAAQMHQEQTAHGNPALRASANGGHPAIAATARPGEFSGRGVVAAREAPAAHEAPAHAPAAREATAAHTPAVGGAGPRAPEHTDALRGPAGAGPQRAPDVIQHEATHVNGTPAPRAAAPPPPAHVQHASPPPRAAKPEEKRPEER